MSLTPFVPVPWIPTGLNVFDDMKTGVAGLLGSTPDVAGYLIGLAIVLGVFIMFALIFREEKAISMFAGGITLAIVSLPGIALLPWAVLIFAVLLMAVMLIGLFRSG